MEKVSYIKKFTNKDEELEYWKNLACRMCDRKRKAERELDTYMKNKQVPEQETDLQSREKIITWNQRLLEKNAKLMTINEYLKINMERQMNAISNLLSENKALNAYKSGLSLMIKDLKQKVEHLKRTNFELRNTEDKLEHQYSLTLEKIPLIEAEVQKATENFESLAARLLSENEDLKRQLNNVHNFFETQRLGPSPTSSSSSSPAENEFSDSLMV